MIKQLEQICIWKESVEDNNHPEGYLSYFKHQCDGKNEECVYYISQTPLNSNL